MSKKIVIDAGHGGEDRGNVGNGIVEKDYTLLISNYIKNRLDDLGIDNIVTRNTDRGISIDERLNIMQGEYGLSNDVIVVSNHLNKGGNSGLEVIYALRDRDNLAEEISNQVTSAGGIVNKYYQLRNPEDTQYDYYEIIRDTPNYETVMIKYGYVDNLEDANRIKNDYKKYAEAVVRALTLYVGAEYVPLKGDIYYVVESGDSLWKIANDYGISVDELKNANNLKSNILNIGQLLMIPKKNSDNQNTGSKNIYVVKAGDSLWKISNSFGITVNELKDFNDLTSDNLSIGQELKIPSSSKYNTYIVKIGDSLWKISNNYGISVDELKKINNLGTDFLSIGQELKVPSGSANVYVVRAGDSLWKIAGQFGTSVDKIKEVNNLTSDFLTIGQKLIV